MIRQNHIAVLLLDLRACPNSTYLAILPHQPTSAPKHQTEKGKMRQEGTEREREREKWENEVNERKRIGRKKEKKHRIESFASSALGRRPCQRLSPIRVARDYYMLDLRQTN